MKRVLVGLLVVFAVAVKAEEREFVNLPPMMQEHMLANMRDHLVTIDKALALMASGELEQAGELVEKRLGMSSLESHGAAPMAKLMPPGMQQAGTEMHHAASRFALVAQEGEALSAYKALREVTASCVACHSAYRIR